MGNRGRDMTDEQKLAEDRRLARSHLDGTLLVPTKVCISCAERVRFGDMTLEMDEGSGFMGTAGGIETAVCDNPACRNVFVRDGSWRGGRNWRLGSSRVEPAPGDPFALRDLPLVFTLRQRAAMEAFLKETAPSAA